MPYIPHTEKDIQEMLDAIGVDSIEQLFDEVPAELKNGELNSVPPGASEMEVTALMSERARQDDGVLNFIGAGAYEHHIPAAIWDIAARGEFMTAYTPYQAEASQGTLQLIYEYQSMMTQLTAMDVSNASMYDGASALAEAVLMAVRVQRKSKSRKLLVLGSVHPAYREVVESIVKNQHIELVEVPFDDASGVVDLTALEPFAGQDFAGLIVSQPSFIGTLEDVDGLTDWAHSNKMLLISVVNPTSLALLKPPGEWGEIGADIVVGEGQPLGIPLASGGPYFGFMCCKQAYVRQMPGRIIGKTVDQEGRPGYVLTLQAREQHIRRSKATSNICTNQGWAVTAATIYMSLLGSKGLYGVALACHNKLSQLLTSLTEVPGVEVRFTSPNFHEAVIQLPCDEKEVIRLMAQRKISAGYSLSQTALPGMKNCLLVCATETKTDGQIQTYADCLKDVLESVGSESC
ncbi:MAG: aminomethyl-transferring glycine dehydrogenase [Gammaproteobacteria bacterium]|nr:MAG: aminomethyl-transferring glycine dehydrogenase [Gammaproteobacteria bacterium]